MLRLGPFLNVELLESLEDAFMGHKDRTFGQCLRRDHHVRVTGSSVSTALLYRRLTSSVIPRIYKTGVCSI